jgi:hypothetical protein
MFRNSTDSVGNTRHCKFKRVAHSTRLGGSGQPDLTPAALASTAWGTWKRVGERKLHLVARFWTYNADATPSGFAAQDSIFTLSKDGKAYHGEGPTQFFDNDGNPLGPPSATFDDGTRITFP